LGSITQVPAPRELVFDVELLRARLVDWSATRDGITLAPTIDSWPAALRPAISAHLSIGKLSKLPMTGPDIDGWAERVAYSIGYPRIVMQAHIHLPL